jgi:hypothetical protein
MTVRKPPVFAAALVALVASVSASPTMAAVDSKSISPSTCQPRGPDTTASELTYSPYGLTNPGSSNVTVICPINGDTESNWGTTETVDSPYLSVYYRAGAIAGSVGCTVFTGSSVVATAPTYSKSYTPAPAPANTRANFRLNLVEASGLYAVAPPTVLVCTISPKATLGWIYLKETSVTHVP